jgi:hypothetical protein
MALVAIKLVCGMKSTNFGRMCPKYWTDHAAHRTLMRGSRRRQVTNEPGAATMRSVVMVL